MRQAVTIDKIKDYTFASLPNLLDTGKLIKKFFEGNHLKKKIVNAPYFDFLKGCCESQVFQDSLRLAFWLVFTITFKPHLEGVIQELATAIRKLNKSLAIQFFSNPFREELIIVYEFCQAFLVHFGMAEVFPQDFSKVATSRFILDCYHIMLFQQRGFLVSDFYLKAKLDKIFGMPSFAYLNQKATIQKRLFMNKSCSNFEKLMETQTDPKEATIFPQFGSIKTQLRKIHQSSAYDLYEKLKYRQIDYSEHLAEKASVKGHRHASSQLQSSESNPSEPSPVSNKNLVRIRNLKTRGVSQGADHGFALQQKQLEEAGLHKKKADMYRLGFPCNKLSPAIEEDLAASFKINLKPNLKKTIHFTLVDDPTKTTSPTELYRLLQGKKAGKDKGVAGSKKGRTVGEHQTGESMLRGTGHIASVKDFLRGYDELAALNNFMGGEKPVARLAKLDALV